MVQAAWPKEEAPHNLKRFLDWYRVYLASLEMDDHDRNKLRSKEINMWLDVCMRTDTADTKFCDLQ